MPLARIKPGTTLPLFSVVMAGSYSKHSI